jgi:hypothetical protein
MIRIFQTDRDCGQISFQLEFVVESAVHLENLNYCPKLLDPFSAQPRVHCEPIWRSVSSRWPL